MASKNLGDTSSTDRADNQRLIFITGDKGGVGKTTFARGLLQVYTNHKLNYLAYDSDKRNAQLYRHYNLVVPGVRLLDIFTRGGADNLLVDLDTNKPGLVLVDLPAQSGSFFEELEKDLGLFDAAKDLGYQITMVSVLSRVKDSVNALRSLFEYCSLKVDYVVVKNLFHGELDKFERYQDSDTRSKVIAAGGMEVLMPDLFYKPYDFIDLHNLSFQEVFTHTESNIVVKSRVGAWLKEFEQNVMVAALLLGLKDHRATNTA